MEWFLITILGSSTFYYGYHYYSFRSNQSLAISADSEDSDLVLSSLHHPDDNVALRNALIVLGSAVASADGLVVSSEVSVITGHLKLDNLAIKEATKLFEAAKGLKIKNTTYAKLIASRFSRPDLREKIIQFLMEIAEADGIVHHSEMEIINEIRLAFE